MFASIIYLIFIILFVFGAEKLLGIKIPILAMYISVVLWQLAEFLSNKIYSK